VFDQVKGAKFDRNSERNICEKANNGNSFWSITNRFLLEIEISSRYRYGEKIANHMTFN